MRDNELQPLDKHYSDQLRTYAAKAKRLGELNKLLQGFIDPGMRGHVIVANEEGKRLCLMADNASVATMLRYQLTTLLKQLQQHPRCRQVKTIDVITGDVTSGEIGR